MNNYKDLNVWKEAVESSVEVYQITNNFPKAEVFGLVQQMRRASISVSSNIAEGAGRNNKGEFVHFLGIAAASMCEVESQLIVSSKLGFVDLNKVSKELDRIDKIQKMIYKLIHSMK
ncbi:MAG: four helix bundle protein [Flavobacteriales bacterium]|jgi:four helix bundle protein|nr:four helix bundle protein [Flavobacteriales bacterium]